MYLSFDPGKTTGWALFDDVGQVMSTGQDTIEQLIAHCEEWRKYALKAIIYEDFVIFKHKAAKMAGSRMEASQAIGIIKGLAQYNNVELVRQGSDIKPIAQKWTQIKPPSDHSKSHWVDAFNHGAYYLIQHKIRKSALEMEQENGM